MTIIGIDPHPGHHTAAALDQAGTVVETRTFTNSQKALGQFIDWLSDMSEPTVAVEGPTQPFFVDWAVRLMAEGHVIIPIPAQLVSGARRRKAQGKTDAMDAEHIGRALLAHPDLSPLSMPSWLVPLKDMVRTRQTLSKDLKAYRMRLNGAREQASREALEAVIEVLKPKLKELDKQIEAKVKELAPQFLDVLGVGPVVASVMLSQAGDINRFRNEDAFASYSGAAPIFWQSGASSVVRVNHGGNRSLNWALHIVALTRLRRDERTRRYFDRKVSEGKSKKSALRCVKTYIAREMYGHLRLLWNHENQGSILYA